MKNDNVTIIVPTDHGGAASAAIIKSVYPNAYVITANYNKDLNYHRIPLESTVFMVGFSLALNEMRNMNTRFDLIWIDFHDVIIQDAQAAGFNPKGVRDTTQTACILIWKYLMGDAPIPKALNAIADYESWKFVKTGNKEPLYLHWALSLNETNPNNAMPFWTRLFANDALYNTLIAHGKLINDYVELVDSICCQDTAYEVTIDGYKCIVSNARISNSLFFKSITEKKPDYYDMAITYGWYDNVKKFRMSFYSLKPSCAVDTIARRFGGGGKPGVAGASVTILPAELADTEAKLSNRDALPYDNIYAESDKLEDMYEIVDKYANSSNKIVMLSQSFDMTMEGKLFLCANIPWMKHKVFNASSNLFNYDFTLSYMLTSTGLIRCVVRPLTADRNVVEQAPAFLAKVMQLPIEQIKIYKVKSESYFCFYMTCLPVRLSFQNEADDSISY